MKDALLVIVTVVFVALLVRRLILGDRLGKEKGR